MGDVYNENTGYILRNGRWVRSTPGSVDGGARRVTGDPRDDLRTSPAGGELDLLGDDLLHLSLNRRVAKFFHGADVNVTNYLIDSRAGLGALLGEKRELLATLEEKSREVKRSFEKKRKAHELVDAGYDELVSLLGSMPIEYRRQVEIPGIFERGAAVKPRAGATLDDELRAVKMMRVHHPSEEVRRITGSIVDNFNTWRREDNELSVLTGEENTARQKLAESEQKILRKNQEIEEGVQRTSHGLTYYYGDGGVSLTPHEIAENFTGRVPSTERVESLVKRGTSNNVSVGEKNHAVAQLREDARRSAVEADIAGRAAQRLRSGLEKLGVDDLPHSHEVEELWEYYQEYPRDSEHYDAVESYVSSVVIAAKLERHSENAEGGAMIISHSMGWDYVGDENDTPLDNSVHSEPGDSYFGENPSMGGARATRVGQPRSYTVGVEQPRTLWGTIGATMWSLFGGLLRR